MLLEYWNDETIQEKAKKNSVAQKADESQPCFGEVFVETRKRVEGREYKTNPEIITKKIKKINEKLSTEDAPDELLSNRKHGPHWLLGRCVKPPKVSSSNVPTDTYVNELTTKIKQGLAAEVEEKMNMKVQQNLASVLKKIGEVNPNIKIDIEEFCVTATSDGDGTPITGGFSF
ncbi:hypothetical protein POM88_005369 [Heracleum sosnowskyi]|uniref:Uncharacterized protein n=1 Tax=Heracleum sosnowskyi TaxID=360622 RepID=A0AAD8JLS5_9APIA|nr:hypothetical protein POM88_005369 [Heracleum sosnowskyi]